MKKTITLTTAVIITMALFISGCANGSNQETAVSTAEETTETKASEDTSAEAEKEDQEAVEEEPVKESEATEETEETANSEEDGVITEEDIPEEKEIEYLAYDDGGDFGKVTTLTDSKKIDDGTEVYSIEVSYIQLDPKYEAAEKINKALKEDAEKSFNSSGSFDEEILKDEEAMEYIKEVPGYYNDVFMGVSYANDDVISLVYQMYDFPNGAAHGIGMTYSYLFDLHTGDKLKLSDIIKVEEEEAKTVIADAFETLIKEGEEGEYWDDALDTVKNTGLDEYNFMVTKDGIKITFGPYELAAYARGDVSVIVPFEKLGMNM
ncbi:MAG: DUF3298 and DUF4163 domain-containing protein [Lachnospiraceae bacterium]|nr:DUF3298 and DUF4163 domain-containing protein [Lachnospiraceae bacterium]